MERPAVALAIVLLSAAAAAGAAPAGKKAASCRTSGLVIWVKFTNQSGHTCTLGGYPGVSAVDLRGHQLGSPGSRNPSPTQARRLANGDTASALLRIAVAGNFPSSVCRRRAAAGLRVYPPNQTSAKIVPLPFEACSRPGPRFLSVDGVA